MTIAQIAWTAGFSTMLGLIAFLLYTVRMRQIKRDDMTPYCVIKGFRPYNFHKHLCKKVYVGSYYKHFNERAGYYWSDPTANLPQIIARDEEGVPLDPKLKQLGIDFAMKSSLLFACGEDYDTIVELQEQLIALLRRIDLRGHVLTREALMRRRVQQSAIVEYEEVTLSH